MDHHSRYSNILCLLSSTQAEVTEDQITALLEATGNTEVEAFYPIIFASFLNSPKEIAELIAMPSVGGDGCGGSGGEKESAPADREAPAKEKGKDKEEPVGEPVSFEGTLSMFDDDEDGDY